MVYVLIGLAVCVACVFAWLLWLMAGRIDDLAAAVTRNHIEHAAATGEVVAHVRTEQAKRHHLRELLGTTEGRDMLRQRIAERHAKRA